MDADLSTPMSQLDRLEEQLDAGHDVAIGSRGLPGSDLVQRQALAREHMGKMFNRMVCLLVLDGFKDTQCGFKLFTAEAAKHLFGGSTLDGFAFDVELLLLARDRYRVAEVPVVWAHSPESRVSPIRDAFKMFTDLIALRRIRPSL